ncbi:XRE family transcriptional regulator [Acidocella sp. MX-AZ02]|nr:XRE family transcriptional regulator [Acidocella sp. MX-AZ02]
MQTETFITPRSPGDLDKLIGSKIRLRRAFHRISLESLAKNLNITYQQLQKYENGKNRISASRLFEVAQLLKVEVSFFFVETDES